VFVLDTNVVSELRQGRTRRADPNVTTWARSVAPADLYLSAVTVLELELGVRRMERRDEGQGAALRAWLDGQVRPAFQGRVLPFDEAAALRCAGLHVPDDRSDRDAMIAATALVHAMTVVTRNAADFAPTGVALLNPWLESERAGKDG
jgi:predicted nucleic acid-binding protein